MWTHLHRHEWEDAPKKDFVSWVFNHTGHLQEFIKHPQVIRFMPDVFRMYLSFGRQRSQNITKCFGQFSKVRSDLGMTVFH